MNDNGDRIGKRDRKELTDKERKFIEYFTSGMGIVEASKAAGYAHYQSAIEAVKRPIVSEKLQKAFKKFKINDKQVAQKLYDGLEATKFTQGGVEVPDYTVRAKYLEMLLRILGYYVPEKFDIKAEHEVKPVVWHYIKYTDVFIKKWWEFKAQGIPDEALEIVSGPDSEAENKSLTKSEIPSPLKQIGMPANRTRETQPQIENKTPANSPLKS